MSSELFRALLEAAPDAFVIAEEDGRIMLVNGQAERMFGYATGELVGRAIEDLVPVGARERHAAHRDRFAADPRARAMGSQLDLRAVRKDGAEFAIEISLSVLRTDASRLVLAAIRDVTERKRLEQRLALSERLASIGGMAAGLAHEINNPLAAILANVEFSAREAVEIASSSADRAELGRRIREMSGALADAHEAGTRVQRLIHELKSFARVEVLPTRPIVLSRALEGAAKLVDHQLEGRARLVIEDRGAPPVDANEDRLIQVFVNLLVNAIQAFGPGSTNEIRVMTTSELGAALVEVRDNGPGIAPADLGKIFEPFFTTKQAGTGLGLAICRAILASMGGTITASSVVGGGTTFQIRLPEARGTAPPRPSERDRVGPTRRGRVLVVDDQPAVARALARLLRDEHDVVFETDPTLALALIERTPYDVIFCDLMMPRMRGIELFKAVRARDPRAAGAFVFTTGGVPSPDDATFLSGIPNALITKPFSTERLHEVVASRL